MQYWEDGKGLQASTWWDSNPRQLNYEAAPWPKPSDIIIENVASEFTRIRAEQQHTLIKVVILSWQQNF